MGILALAKSAAKGTATFMWRESGASSVPMFRDGANFIKKGSSNIASKFKRTNDKPAKKTSIESNNDAHARAMEASQLKGKEACCGEKIPKEMVEDIHQIKELTKKMLENGRSGFGGLLGGLAGFMGGKIAAMFGGLASKLGLGRLAGVLAGGGALIKGAGSIASKIGSGAVSLASKAAAFGKPILARVPLIGKFFKDSPPTNITPMTNKSSGIFQKVKDFGNGLLEKGKGFLNTSVDKGKTLLSGIADKGTSIKSGGAKLASVAALGTGLLSAGKEKASNIFQSAKSLIGKGLTTVGESVKSLLPTGESVAKTATATAGKSGLKQVIKSIPIIGLLTRAGLATKRAISGDWTGAGLEIASGIASTVPGLGTAASLALDGGLIARDLMNPQEDRESQKTTKEPTIEDRGFQKTLVKEDKEKVQLTHTLFENFLQASLDKDKGIFVRPASNPFESKDTLANLLPVSHVKKDSIEEPIKRGTRDNISQTVTTKNERKSESRSRITPKPLNNEIVSNNFERATPIQGIAASPLAALIQKGEGDYNSYNAGTKGVAGGKVRYSGKKNLSEMTINEIIRSSETKDGNDKDRIFAAGRYQIITPTLKASMKKMGLTGEEKFTPEMQDRIFQETLLPKAARDYIEGKSNNLEAAQIGMAQVWRSFADPRTGKTYADSGAIANKAHISAEQSAKALKETRAQYAKGSLTPATAQDSQEMAEVSERVNESKNVQQPIIVNQQNGSLEDYSMRNIAGASSSDSMGPMITRNDDSSIRRLTDLKMGYSMA